MFNFFRRNKVVGTTNNKKSELNKLVEDFISSYNSNDTYYKVSYYDTTYGIWKETNPIYNTKQAAQEAANTAMRNCHSITIDLIKVKSYVY